jgi:hypothetical protein
VRTSASDPQAPSTWPLALADGFTSFVLLLVVAAVAWMTVADSLPGSCRLPSLEAEILCVLALFTVALAAVSALALLRTRQHS